MSSIIDPILRIYPPTRKLGVATLSFGSGTSIATGNVNGLDAVQQILSVTLEGTGVTVQTTGNILNAFFTPGTNLVGVSLNGAVGPSVKALVFAQGY